MLEEDSLAHRAEHSLEVELPFLQYLFSRTGEKIKIVPIVIGGGNLSDYQKLGKELYQAVGQAKKKIVALASSDMTHYEAQEAAESKDKKALDKILNLDEKGLLDIIDEYNISGLKGHVTGNVKIIHSESKPIRNTNQKPSLFRQTGLLQTISWQQLR